MYLQTLLEVLANAKPEFETEAIVVEEESKHKRPADSRAGQVLFRFL